MIKNPTTAYLDTATRTLTLVTAQGAELLKRTAPRGIAASEAGRQGAWIRDTLRREGFNPSQRVEAYPYGISVPLASE